MIVCVCVGVGGYSDFVCGDAAVIVCMCVCVLGDTAVTVCVCVFGGGMLQ